MLPLEWKNGSEGMRRVVLGDGGVPVPGGVRAYIVSNGPAALALGVRGSDVMSMCMCLPFPGNEDDVRSGAPPRACEYVEGGRCWAGPMWCLYAMELFAEHGDGAAVEQPEALWTALEQLLRGAFATKEQKFGGLKQCDRCGGRGVVR